MHKCLLIFLFVLGLSACSPIPKSLLRPTRETLTHHVDEKFVGHDGIKKLCETHLGMKYLLKPEIALKALKNRSKRDLVDPKIYEADELKFAAQVRDAYLVDAYVKFIDDELGYGVFANAAVKDGDLIGEYTGVIDASDNIDDHTWSWSFPREIYNPSLNLPDISVNGKDSGNALRFVNHSDNPNTEMREIFLDGIVRTLYIATKAIARDEQLLISYGTRYWEKRKKKQI